MGLREHPLSHAHIHQPVTMAACYDPLVPTQQTPVHPSPPRQLPAAVACIGLLHDAASNRTFRIPDVPATSSVAHIKQWYCKNVAAVEPRHVVVVHNGHPVNDVTQVWQLAQGQGQFAVSVTAAQNSPRSILSVHVDTALPGPPLALQISSDSTVLKQRVLELINQPMALATSAQTILILPPGNAPLDNSRTLAECGVVSNTRLSFSFAQQGLITPVPQPAVASSQAEVSRLRQIWSSPSPISTSHATSNTPTSHVLLPSLLLDDDEDMYCSSCSSCSSCGTCSPGASPGHSPWSSPSHGEHHSMREPQPRRNRGGRRSHSPPMSQELGAEQMRDLAANFRTKMCRNGRSCKFGRNCWFAHTGDELRKPSDPLPNNLPAVHKLERYSHREAQEKSQ